MHRWDGTVSTVQKATRRVTTHQCCPFYAAASAQKVHTPRTCTALSRAARTTHPSTKLTSSSWLKADSRSSSLSVLAAARRRSSVGCQHLASCTSNKEGTGAITEASRGDADDDADAVSWMAAGATHWPKLRPLLGEGEEGERSGMELCSWLVRGAGWVGGGCWWDGEVDGWRQPMWMGWACVWGPNGARERAV